MQPRPTAALWGLRVPGAPLESLGLWRQAPLALLEGATCSVLPPGQEGACGAPSVLGG